MVNHLLTESPTLVSEVSNKCLIARLPDRFPQVRPLSLGKPHLLAVAARYDKLAVGYEIVPHIAVINDWLLTHLRQNLVLGEDLADGKVAAAGLTGMTLLEAEQFVEPDPSV